MVIRFRLSFCWACLFVIFLLQDALAVLFPFASYLDELETIFVLACLVVYGLKGKNLLRDKEIGGLVGIWGLLVLVGLIGNIIFQYQSIIYVLLDLLTYSKFLINFLGAVLFFRNSKYKVYEDTVFIVSSMVTLILFALVVRDTFFTPVFPFLEDRYGVRSLQLFFSNQTYLAVTGVLLLIFHYCFGKERKGVKLWIILDALITVSTFRSKALGFVAIALSIIFLMNRIKKINYKKLALIGSVLVILAIYIGWDSLRYYFWIGGKYSLRLLILRGGIVLANKLPPFGMGFATYCSLGSKLNVSPVYGLLGMDKLYMMEGMYDMFWGSVIGQFGYLGLLIYILYLIALCRMIIKWKNYDNTYFWTGIMLLAYLIIASFGEASFNTYYGCIAGLFLGYVNMRKGVIENEKNTIAH